VLPQGTDPFPVVTPPTDSKHLLALWIVLGLIGLIAIVAGVVFCVKHQKQK